MMLQLDQFWGWVDGVLRTCTFKDIVTIVLGFLGLRSFNKYRQQKRSEAAASAYEAFQCFFDYVDQISSSPDLYENEGFYPFAIPEIANNDGVAVQHPERPARLIFNECGNLRQKLNAPLAQIGGKESLKLWQLFALIQNKANFIGRSHYAVAAGQSQDIVTKTQNLLPGYVKELKADRAEVEGILILIINGHWIALKWRRIKLKTLAAWHAVAAPMTFKL